jgi:hypothetical protein
VIVGNDPVTVKVAVAEPPDVVIVTVYAPVAAVLAITKLADCDVAVPPPAKVAVTPVPLTLMLGLFRFVPVMVTGTVWPCTPVAGDRVKVGTAPVTVKVEVTEPAAVVMVIVRAPTVALLAITKLADCDVADPPPANVAVTPVPLTLMLGLFRFVPVIATGTVWPCAPAAGDSAVMVGNAPVTVKVAVAEPPAVVIVTVYVPVAAVLAITKLADCKAAVPPPARVAVTPVPLTLMLGLLRFVPVMVTGTV